MHQRERTGGEIAWEELCWEGAALKMRSCWRGFYTEQLTEELYTEELYTEDLLHREACTQRGLYTQNLLHGETFNANTGLINHPPEGQGRPCKVFFGFPLNKRTLSHKILDMIRFDS